MCVCARVHTCTDVRESACARGRKRECVSEKEYNVCLRGRVVYVCLRERVRECV